MDSPDLQAKYQKLASEYSKLKAQNQVLKRAVVEEQGKISNLRDNLKARDQILRKKEQELDSLSFRNQQLTKRLSLLQEDIETSKHAKSPRNISKKDDFSSDSAQDQSVFLEELQLKINENSRLHAEMNEVESFYKAKVLNLESKLVDQSQEVEKWNEDDQLKFDSLQSHIKKLENDVLGREILIQEKDSKIKTLEQEISSTKSSSLNGSDSSNGTGSRNHYRPSSLSSSYDYHKINFSSDSCTNNYISKPVDGSILKKFSICIRDLSSSFIGFFQSYFSALKQSSWTFSSNTEIDEEVECWNLLSRCFDEIFSKSDDALIMLENLSGLDMFSKVLSNCATYLRKLLPLLSEGVQDGLTDSPWRSALGRLVSSWSALSPYLTTLAAYSEGKTSLNGFAVRKILNLLHERVVKLQVTSKELSSAWEKLAHSNNEKNESSAVQRFLSSIESALSQICFLLTDILLPCEGISCASSPPSSVNTLSPATPSLAICYSAPPLFVNQDSNCCQFSSQDSSCNPNIEDVSLAQQLALSISKLLKLEEEKEYWRLEHQLLCHRYDREVKKSPRIDEKNLSTQMNNSVADPERESSTNVKISCSLVSGSSITEVHTAGSCHREKEIRDHFTNICSQMYMQLTLCTSEVVLYQDECEALMRRLSIAEDHRIRAEQEMDILRKEILKTNETLSTTSRNYEEQISTMSDYLADLNDKIAKQTDQIEELKFEMKKKGKK